MTHSATPDRALGALLGAALGDALGKPAANMSHQTLRMYYKGIKGFMKDERNTLPAGWGTHRTALLLGHPLPDPHPDDFRTESARVLPALRTALRDGRIPYLLETCKGEAPDVRAGYMLLGVAGSRVLQAQDHSEITALWDELAPLAEAFERQTGASTALSTRLRALPRPFTHFPLDLADLCDGTHGSVDTVLPFALAMFVRNPSLTEATLLASINVGGDAPTTGAIVGGLLGSWNGWSAFPEEWRTGLQPSEELYTTATGIIQDIFC